MKKILFFLLVMTGAVSVNAQWGYDPYSAQLQMMTQMYMQQAQQAIQQSQQQMQFQYNPAPAVVPQFVVPSAPVAPAAPSYDTPSHETQKRDNLNRVYGEDCRSCHGTGKCKACNGTKVAHGMGNTYRCNVCVANGNCSVCGGTGKTSWNR